MVGVSVGQGGKRKAQEGSGVTALEEQSRRSKNTRHVPGQGKLTG